MLPFGMRGAVMISVVSALSHIVVLTVESLTFQENTDSIPFQVRKLLGCIMKYSSQVTLSFGITILFRKIAEFHIDVSSSEFRAWAPKPLGFL